MSEQQLVLSNFKRHRRSCVCCAGWDNKDGQMERSLPLVFLLYKTSEAGSSIDCGSTVYDKKDLGPIYYLEAMCCMMIRGQSTSSSDPFR